MRRLKIVAIYHECMASAALKWLEALKEPDEEEQICLRREAQVFETCSTWLHDAARL